MIRAEIGLKNMSTFSEERFVDVSEAEPSTDIDHSYP
jgi:hypothetical protein